MELVFKVGEQVVGKVSMARTENILVPGVGDTVKLEKLDSSLASGVQSTVMVKVKSRHISIRGFPERYALDAIGVCDEIVTFACVRVKG